MSDTKAHSEPTMEEILASIRRIISDDGAEGAGEPAKAEAPPAAAPSFTPAPAPSSAFAPADVLELTQMVKDDGSVVDLAADAAASETVPPPESSMAPEVPTAMAETPPPEPESEPESEPEAVMAPEPPPEPAPMARATEPVAGATRPSAKQEMPMPPDNTPDEPGLMSPAPSGTTTSAFAALAAAVDASRGLPVGTGSRTLEDLVRELLRPMLRQWLDANLPALVGRIVEREVAKLAGRAEDDHWH